MELSILICKDQKGSEAKRGLAVDTVFSLLPKTSTGLLTGSKLVSNLH
jgi:hypothetical protein